MVTSGRDGAFAGAWQDDEGTVVVVKDSRMYGPDGGQLDLKITSQTTCSFQMGSEVYKGTLNSDGKLEWNDGAVWIRVNGANDSQSKEEEEAPQDSSIEKARKAFAEEKARKAAALDKARAARNAAQNQDGSYHDTGVDRAKQAFEEEKARKAAALERARRGSAENSHPNRGGADAPQDMTTRNDVGVDRARQAFEEEKARKAAALERARRASAENQAAPAQETRQADAGVDRAKQAFEEEKARKAAALERARRASAENQAAPAQETRQADAGVDRAKQAFEEEKARKAAALERARHFKVDMCDHVWPRRLERMIVGTDLQLYNGVDRAKQALRAISGKLVNATIDEAFEEEKARKAAALERARIVGLQGFSVAKIAFEQEKARKAAALERARAARAEARGEGLGASEGQPKEEEAPQDSSIEKARKAFAEEKARKAAALEKARAAMAAAQNQDESNHDTGVDRAKQAFEEEKARKAAALERARRARAAESSQPNGVEAPQDNGAKSDVGMDRARQAFEEEKARKAAALERARRASAENQAATATAQDTRQGAAAGMDRAKQAFEQEKARKAAALERAPRLIVNVAHTGRRPRLTAHMFGCHHDDWAIAFASWNVTSIWALLSVSVLFWLMQGVFYLLQIASISIPAALIFNLLDLQLTGRCWLWWQELLNWIYLLMLIPLAYMVLALIQLSRGGRESSTSGEPTSVPLVVEESRIAVETRGDVGSAIEVTPPGLEASATAPEPLGWLTMQHSEHGGALEHRREEAASTCRESVEASTMRVARPSCTASASESAAFIAAAMHVEED
ncbi:unnamed protein product [Symbiodinium sp. CCMP2592]|nr:unnamed protein product [Symbiodinium sp. CCMP2592]